LVLPANNWEKKDRKGFLNCCSDDDDDVWDTGDDAMETRAALEKAHEELHNNVVARTIER
jgi:hypothetical protein